MPAHDSLPQQLEPGFGRMGHLLRLSAPLMLGLSAISVMEFCDRLFLGWLRPESLAASLPAGLVTYVLLILFTGTASYTNTIVAQHAGAGNHRQCGPATWPGIWVGVMSLLLGLLLIPFMSPLFSLMNAEAQVHRDAVVLASWYLCCQGPIAIIHAIAGYFNGLGRTHVMLITCIIILLLNIFLNYALIFGHFGFPRLETHDAGVATLVSCLLPAIGMLCCFLRKAEREQYHSHRDWQLRWQSLKSFCQPAIPQGIRLFIDHVGWACFALAVASFGTVAAAANTVVLNWNILTFIPMIGLSQGFTVAVGQAIGSGRKDLAARIARRGLLLMFIYAIPVALITVIFREQFITLSLGANTVGAQAEAIMAASSTLFFFAAVWYAGDALNLTYAGSLAGAGDTHWQMKASLLTCLVFFGLPLGMSIAAPEQFLAELNLSRLHAAWLSACIFVCAIGSVQCWRWLSHKWHTVADQHQLGQA